VAGEGNPAEALPAASGKNCLRTGVEAGSGTLKGRWRDRERERGTIL